MTQTDHSILLFRVAGIGCAISALEVDSIIQPPEHITATPGASITNPGIFHHLTGTVAVIDLRKKFAGPDYEPADTQGRILLTHLDDTQYGFYVDQIIGIVQPEQVKTTALPPKLSNIFTSALFYQEEIILFSNFARLLAMPRSDTLLIHHTIQSQASSEKKDDNRTVSAKNKLTETAAKSDTTSKQPKPTRQAFSERQKTKDEKPAVNTSSITTENAQPEIINKPTEQKKDSPPAPATNKHDLKQAAHEDSITQSVTGSSDIPGSVSDHETSKMADTSRHDAPVKQQIKVNKPAVEQAIKDNLYKEKQPATPEPETKSTDEQSTRINKPLDALIAEQTTTEAQEAEIKLDHADSASPTVDTHPQRSSAPYAYIVSILLIVGVIAWFYFPTDNAPLETDDLTAEIKNSNITATPEIRHDTPITAKITVDDMRVEKNADGLSLIIETSDSTQATLPGHEEEPVISEQPAQQVENTKVALEPDIPIEVTATTLPTSRDKINNVKTISNTRIFIHTVKKGDTLWDIARHYINDPWRYRDLVSENNIDNPDLIYPGEKVKIIFQESK